MCLFVNAKWFETRKRAYKRFGWVNGNEMCINILLFEFVLGLLFPFDLSRATTAPKRLCSMYSFNTYTNTHSLYNRTTVPHTERFIWFLYKAGCDSTKAHETQTKSTHTHKRQILFYLSVVVVVVSSFWLKNCGLKEMGTTDTKKNPHEKHTNIRTILLFMYYYPISRYISPSIQTLSGCYNLFCFDAHLLCVVLLR